MSVNRRGTSTLMGLLAGLGVVSIAGVAQAATVQLSTGVLLVKESSNGEVKRGTGAGVLMPRLTPMNGNKLLAIWMDSAPDSMVPPPNGSDNNGRWEGKVAVIQLNAEGPPTISATKQITQFDGDRPFNHPRIASAGDYAIVNFASTIEAPDTTNQYVMVVDSTGSVAPLTGTTLNQDQVQDDNGQMLPVLNVGLNDGDNHGASDMSYIGKTPNGADHFLGGFQHNNNESYVFDLTVTKTGNGYNAVQNWSTIIARPANIGRPTCAVTSATTSTCCSAKGDNRPPEYGVQCVQLNTDTGQIITKSLVAASDPQNHVYMNQPTITYLGNNLCGLGVVMSDGRGRERDGHFLGANTSMALTIDCTTLAIKDKQMGVAPFQRHAITTSSLFGNQGQTFMGSLGCSSTGAGAAGLQLIAVDNATGKMTVDKLNNMMPVMWQCDTAWLAYKGLRNPRDQGREFLHTVGSVPNPGFQDPKGWMPEVSHFAVSLIPAVKNMTATRNSLFMSFVPIAWDKNVQVSMGAAVDVSQIPAGPSPTVNDGTPTVGGGDPNVNGGGGTSAGGGNSPGGVRHHGFLGFNDGGGCSVGAVGETPAEGVEGLALVGLGLAVAASRRRR
jgi:MYXO-CTERM domain-containing protein